MFDNTWIILKGNYCNVFFLFYFFKFYFMNLIFTNYVKIVTLEFQFMIISGYCFIGVITELETDSVISYQSFYDYTSIHWDCMTVWSRGMIKLSKREPCTSNRINTTLCRWIRINFWSITQISVREKQKIEYA